MWLCCADVLLCCCACSGDHALTGLAIGKMLGIAGNGSVVTGPELDAMSDDQLKLVSSSFLVTVCHSRTEHTQQGIGSVGRRLGQQRTPPFRMVLARAYTDSIT